MTSSLKFATKTAQQQKIPMGDRSFISKRLTGEEELIYQEYDILSSTQLTMKDKLNASVDMLYSLLRNRMEGVDREWVARNTNATIEADLIVFLRTGHDGPGFVPKDADAFNLKVFELEIGDRRFGGKVLSYHDLMRYAEHRIETDIMEEVGGLETSTLESVEDIQKMSKNLVNRLSGAHHKLADATAEALNERISDGGEPITGAWLLQHLTLEENAVLQSFIMNGESIEPGAEEDESSKAQGSDDEMPAPLLTVN